MNTTSFTKVFLVSSALTAGVNIAACAAGQPTADLTNAPGEPTPAAAFDGSAIHQGMLGDCWLLASLWSVAARRPDVLSQLIRTDATDANTYFVGVVSTDGTTRWSHLRTSGEFVDLRDNQVSGAEAFNWPSLYEQALGIGQLQAVVDGGNPADAYAALGLVASGVLGDDTQSVRAALTDAPNRPTVACTHTHVAETSALVPSHCYGVKGISVSGNVNLVNPWFANVTVSVSPADFFAGLDLVNFIP